MLLREREHRREDVPVAPTGCSAMPSLRKKTLRSSSRFRIAVAYAARTTLFPATGAGIRWPFPTSKLASCVGAGFPVPRHAGVEDSEPEDFVPGPQTPKQHFSVGVGPNLIGENGNEQAALQEPQRVVELRCDSARRPIQEMPASTSRSSRSGALHRFGAGGSGR